MEHYSKASTYICIRADGEGVLVCEEVETIALSSCQVEVLQRKDFMNTSLNDNSEGINRTRIAYCQTTKDEMQRWLENTRQRLSEHIHMLTAGRHPQQLRSHRCQQQTDGMLLGLKTGQPEPYSMSMRKCPGEKIRICSTQKKLRQEKQHTK